MHGTMGTAQEPQHKYHMDAKTLSGSELMSQVYGWHYSCC